MIFIRQQIHRKLGGGCFVSLALADVAAVRLAVIVTSLQNRSRTETLQYMDSCGPKNASILWMWRCTSALCACTCTCTLCECAHAQTRSVHMHLDISWLDTGKQCDGLEVTHENSKQHWWSFQSAFGGPFKPSWAFFCATCFDKIYTNTHMCVCSAKQWRGDNDCGMNVQAVAMMRLWHECAGIKVWWSWVTDFSSSSPSVSCICKNNVLSDLSPFAVQTCGWKQSYVCMYVCMYVCIILLTHVWHTHKHRSLHIHRIRMWHTHK